MTGLAVTPVLSLAIQSYDRHAPLLEGRVVCDQLELRVMEVGMAAPGRYGLDRHDRMLRGHEFDVAEVGLMPYLQAKERGAPFTAIPIFPRRLFSQSLIYCNRSAGIRSPADLRGKRMALRTYDTTLSVLVRGDLQDEYGVPWKDIRWVTARPETASYTLPTGVTVELAPEDRHIADLLLTGEVDALAMPHSPARVQRAEPEVGRLFPNARLEEVKYFRKHGAYPIMHLVAVRDEVLHRYPWVARSVYDAFERAYAVARERYEDPNWTMLAWASYAHEEQAELLHADPWTNGVAANRKGLERLIGYAHEQGLLERRLTIEELFDSSTLVT